MKSSLEDERRALLDQIEARRTHYRRLLLDDQKTAGSRSIQWVKDHPLWIIGGAVLVALVARRVIGAGENAMRRNPRDHGAPDGWRWGDGLRALLKAGALMLRHPLRLRTAARLGHTALHWMRRRETGSASTRPVT